MDVRPDVGEYVKTEEDLKNEALEERIAGGTLVQQAGQGVLFLLALAVATALGRNLSVAEFGVYGLVISFASYLSFALGSAEAAAVRMIAAANEQDERDHAFTTAMVVYSGLALVAGAILAVGGWFLLDVFGFSSELLHQARLGVLAMAALTAIGWPARLYVDLLRSSQHFTRTAVAETGGLVVMGVALIVLTVWFDAPLWILIAVGSAPPFFTGFAGIVVAWTTHLQYRLRPSLLRRDSLEEMFRIASGMLVVGISTVLTDSLSRTILALFRSAGSLGLYEAASRLSTYVRTFMNSFSLTLLPVTARLSAEKNDARAAALFLRGTRYILAAIAPPCAVVIVLADRIIAVWLGEGYAAAGTACAILVAAWLIGPNTMIPNAIMLVDGEVRKLATYGWATAILNITLSLILTPLLGVEGIALATSISLLVIFPMYIRYALRRYDISVATLARTAWMPAYVTSAVLAAALVVVRLTVPLDTAPVVIGIVLAGVFSAWLAIFFLWFDAGERQLVRRLFLRGRNEVPAEA